MYRKSESTKDLPIWPRLPPCTWGVKGINTKLWDFCHKKNNPTPPPYPDFIMIICKFSLEMVYNTTIIAKLEFSSNMGMPGIPAPLQTPCTGG